MILAFKVCIHFSVSIYGLTLFFYFICFREVVCLDINKEESEIAFACSDSYILIKDLGNTFVEFHDYQAIKYKDGYEFLYFNSILSYFCLNMKMRCDAYFTV